MGERGRCRERAQRRRRTLAAVEVAPANGQVAVQEAVTTGSLWLSAARVTVEAEREPQRTPQLLASSTSETEFPNAGRPRYSRPPEACVRQSGHDLLGRIDQRVPRLNTSFDLRSSLNSVVSVIVSPSKEYASS